MVEVRVQEMRVFVVELVKVFGVLGHHFVVLLDEAEVGRTVALLRQVHKKVQEGWCKCNCTWKQQRWDCSLSRTCCSVGWDLIHVHTKYIS